MPHYVASHLGLRCFTMSHLWDAMLKWVNVVEQQTFSTHLFSICNQSCAYTNSIQITIQIHYTNSLSFHYSWHQFLRHLKVKIYLLGILANSYYRAPGNVGFLRIPVIFTFLAWAWLAKAKGHSCHTKKSTLAKTFTEKNE